MYNINEFILSISVDVAVAQLLAQKTTVCVDRGSIPNIPEDILITTSHFFLSFFHNIHLKSALVIKGFKKKI